MPSVRTGSPASRWCITGLPTATTSTIRSRGDAGLRADLRDEAVEPLDQLLAEHPRSRGVLVRVGDPADEVLAVGDLRVHRPRARDSRPAREVEQVDRELGRAEVDGEPEAARPAARRLRERRLLAFELHPLGGGEGLGRDVHADVGKRRRLTGQASPSGELLRGELRAAPPRVGSESVAMGQAHPAAPAGPRAPADRLELHAHRLRRGEKRRACGRPARAGRRAGSRRRRRPGRGRRAIERRSTGLPVAATVARGAVVAGPAAVEKTPRPRPTTIESDLRGSIMPSAPRRTPAGAPSKGPKRPKICGWPDFERPARPCPD